MRRMSAWEPVPRTEYANLWNDSTRQFEHGAAWDDLDWPNWNKLAPFITYKLQGWASMEPHSANRWAVGVMRACQPHGKPIVVLDWEQVPWWLDVHHPDALEDWDGSRWLLTLEDYSLFMSRELGSGMLCLDGSFSVFGEPFLKEIRV